MVFFRVANYALFIGHKEKDLLQGFNVTAIDSYVGVERHGVDSDALRGAASVWIGNDDGVDHLCTAAVEGCLGDNDVVDLTIDGTHGHAELMLRATTAHVGGTRRHVGHDERRGLVGLQHEVAVFDVDVIGAGIEVREADAGAVDVVYVESPKVVFEHVHHLGDSHGALLVGHLLALGAGGHCQQKEGKEKEDVAFHKLTYYRFLCANLRRKF